MKAKLLITAAIAAAMALTLCACGQQGASGSAASSGSEAASSASSDAAAASAAAAANADAAGMFATLGDVFASDHGDLSTLYNESSYTCVFELGGAYYRVTADLPAGTFEKLEAEDIDESKTQELLKAVPVTKVDVLAESTPSQEELDALAGKTGAELAAEGYIIDSLVVNGSETDCTASKAPFAYYITFEGATADEDPEDPAAAVADMKAISVGFGGIAWQAIEGE